MWLYLWTLCSFPLTYVLFFLWQYNTVSCLLKLCNSLKSESVMPPALLLFVKIAFTIQDLFISSVHSVVSDSLQPHGLQHARLPCPSPTPGAYTNSCPLSWWGHPTISSSVIPFSSCLQSFPAPGSLPMSQLFASSDQSIGASASVLPMNIQGWFPFGLTRLITLQSKGLSRVFSNTTVQKHQFFGAQLSLEFNSQIHTWLLEKPQLWLDGRSSHC